MDVSSRAALGPARSLALMRCAAGVVIVSSADIHGAVRFAGLAPELATPPAGLAWLAPLALPVAVAEVLRWSVVFTALLGALGVYARAAFAATLLGSLVLLALPQRLGSVVHTHHLIWVCALLAASPCADVWSADAWFERRELRARASYTLPLAFARALLACIYFFPGLHKLLALAQGVDPGTWLLSHLHWKWMQAGHAPSLPFAIEGWRAGLLAVAAIGFELSMPLLVSFRRSRPLALLGACLFQLATAWLFFIRFESLIVLLVALIDLPPRAHADAPLRAIWRSGWLATRRVGSLLVAGAAITGLFGLTQFYPFACYPSFAQPAPSSMPSARVEVIAGGARCALARPRDNAEWVQAFRIAGAYGDASTAARFHAYTARVLRAQAGRCPPDPNATIVLNLERLRWESDGVRVVEARAVYSAPSSSFGIAPAEGRSDSSLPSR